MIDKVNNLPKLYTRSFRLKDEFGNSIERNPQFTARDFLAVWIEAQCRLVTSQVMVTHVDNADGTYTHRFDFTKDANDRQG